MPDGVTKETIEKVHEFTNEITPPLVKVVGELAHEAMVEDPKLVEESALCRIGSQQINIRIKQKGKDVDEDGKPIDVYGQVVVSNKIDLSTHQADYNECIEAINQTFTSSFSSKTKSKK